MYQQKQRIMRHGFALGGNSWDLFWQGKRLKFGDSDGMVPDIGGRFCDLGVIEEIKSPCGSRGLWGLGCKEIPKFS